LRSIDSEQRANNKKSNLQAYLGLCNLILSTVSHKRDVIHYTAESITDSYLQCIWSATFLEFNEAGTSP